MKSEHRHELQRNDLKEITLRAKPWVEKYGVQALVGLVVALVIVAVVMYWISQPKPDAAGWGRLTFAQSIDEFQAVADKHPQSLAGEFGRLRMAELNLEEGILKLYKDHEVALTDLKKAQEEFEAVVNSKQSLPDALKQRALLGLARAQESMCDGDPSAALATYRKLKEDHPGSIYETLVNQKIKELESADGKAFYAWFHSQKPKPADFRKPKDGTAGSSLLPPGFSTPGETPDVSLPPAPTGGKTTPEVPKTETPKTETPAEEPAKPETPKEEPAAEKKTDEEKKPAEEKPAPNP